MKRTLQAAVLLIGALILLHPSLWAQSTSSHDAGCKECHECEIPTKVNPCLKKCPRGQMITVHHSADAGPTIVTLDKIADSSDIYESVKFDHRSHAKMSEMSGGCVQCHHYNLTGAVLACRTCHAVNSTSKAADLSKPGLKGAYHRRCVNCHRESGLDTKCDGSCHYAKSSIAAHAGDAGKPMAESRIVRPDRFVFQSADDEARTVTFFHSDHTDRFGLACSACHANERCSKCHKPEGAAVKTIEHLTGAHDRCSQCHAVDENCGLCHDKQPLARFDHARRARFDLGRFHSTLTCARCHGAKSNYKGLPANCAGCHSGWKVGSFDHTVTGVKLSETHAALDCVSCHVESNFAKTPSCKDCHDDKSYPGQVPGTRIQHALKSKR